MEPLPDTIPNNPMPAVSVNSEPSKEALNKSIVNGNTYILYRKYKAAVIVDPLPMSDTINQLSDLCVVSHSTVCPIAWINSKEQNPSSIVNIGVECNMINLHISIGPEAILSIMGFEL